MDSMFMKKKLHLSNNQRRWIQPSIPRIVSGTWSVLSKYL